MVVFDNSIFCLSLHPDAKPRSGVDRAKERVEFLIERLQEENERIILPAPAMAEFLVLAGKQGPEYIRRLREIAGLRIEPFDEKAAIELADIEIAARQSGNKRGKAKDSDWQKVKFDRQIVAIARVHGAKTIYSDDPDIQKHAKACRIEVISLADLPTRPAVQQVLFEDSAESAPDDTDAKS